MTTDTPTIDLVREFHERFGHPISNDVNALKTMDPGRIHMRLNLIAEEFAELVGAIYGPEAEAAAYSGFAAISERGLDQEPVLDVVEFNDALADLDYVLGGFALEGGSPHSKVVREVHRSNMSKLGEDGNPIYREDGKILKGPNYFAPDIANVLEKHAETVEDRNSQPALFDMDE